MRVAALVLLIAALAAGCRSTPPVTDDSAPAVAVRTSVVTERDWPATFEVGGVVLARETATISSRVLAPVARVVVRPGDRVRRGQILVDLDAADLGAYASRATDAATAAEHAAAAAAADLRAADGGLVLARATLGRIASLYADKSATKQELDEAQAALTAAEGRQAAATARVAGAQADVGAARAAGRAAGITAAFTTLTSPFDGVVTARSVDPGSMATPGAPLLVIENQSAFRLEIRLDASRTPLVRVGQTVPVRLDATGASAPWIDGRVAEISRVDPAGHSFAAKIDLPADPAWRTGLFGRARLAGPARRVLAVPAGAVLQRGQLHYVFVVADDRARLRTVSTGDSADDQVEILDGLAIGEHVVAPVPETLKDGARVSRGAGQ